MTNKKRLAIVCMVLIFSLSIASAAPAVTKNWALKNLVNKLKGYVVPVWQIFKDGTDSSVKWHKWSDNPRFAIYDPAGDSFINNVSAAPSRALIPAIWFDDVVLDRETGLVWEKVPLTSADTWYAAMMLCWDKSKGGRLGWRLPAVEELTSLIDPDMSTPKLPQGHPFAGINPTGEIDYWSSTETASDAAMSVAFFDALRPTGGFSKTVPKNIWCVRGGMGLDED